MALRCWLPIVMSITNHTDDGTVYRQSAQPQADLLRYLNVSCIISKIKVAQ